MPPAAAQFASHDSPHLRRGRLPSWAASIWFHIFLMFVAANGLRSCTGPGQRGEADADWRSVGLVTRTSTSEQGLEAAEPAAQPAESQLTALDTTELPPIDTSELDQPPVPLPEMPSLPSVIGPGARVPSFSSAATGESSVTASGIATAPSAPALARGETDFFGIRDKGETIVYLLDVSGSMTSPPEAIIAAKRELIASLESLVSDQQFQVIFYNERPSVMRLPGSAPQKLYQATDINRTLARQQIAARQAELGTSHLPALAAALELRPDVIFFLTDAEDPALNARQIDEVRRMNAAGARIHAVEFGKGSRLDSSSALERLARQNHGAYQYRDVMKFGK